MMRRHNRLLVAFYVVSDAAFAMLALLIAYWLRFNSGLIEVTKGYPQFAQYAQMLPFIAVLVPVAFHVQGLYRLRRGARGSTTSSPSSSAASWPASSGSSGCSTTRPTTSPTSSSATARTTKPRASCSSSSSPSTSR